LKSTETFDDRYAVDAVRNYFSNFGSLKSTETAPARIFVHLVVEFQQFRLVEEH